MNKTINSLEELNVEAVNFLKKLSKKTKSDKATVVCLSGDLGAGKTAFTKCIAKSLGIDDVVTSPTFILEKVYTLPRESIVGEHFKKLIHIDAYRLSSASEMRALDWEHLLSEEHNLIFIEWPEQVKGAIPDDAIKLSFEYVDEGVRSISGL